MEIAIAVFLGAWITFFSVWAYKTIKKDYSDVKPTANNSGKEGSNE